jgi:hypothetical protein
LRVFSWQIRTESSCGQELTNCLTATYHLTMPQAFCFPTAVWESLAWGALSGRCIWDGCGAVGLHISRFQRGPPFWKSRKKAFLRIYYLSSFAIVQMVRSEENEPKKAPVRQRQRFSRKPSEESTLRRSNPERSRRSDGFVTPPGSFGSRAIFEAFKRCSGTKTKGGSTGSTSTCSFAN